MIRAVDRSPIVFVTQERKQHDLEPALAFGSVETCLPHKFPPRNSRALLTALETALHDYVPGYDYILPMGDPIAIGIATGIAMAKGPKVQFLWWHGKDRVYHKVTINQEETNGLARPAGEGG